MQKRQREDDRTPARSSGGSSTPERPRKRRRRAVERVEPPEVVAPLDPQQILPAEIWYQILQTAPLPGLAGSARDLRALARVATGARCRDLTQGWQRCDGQTLFYEPGRGEEAVECGPDCAQRCRGWAAEALKRMDALLHASVLTEWRGATYPWDAEGTLNFTGLRITAAWIGAMRNAVRAVDPDRVVRPVGSGPVTYADGATGAVPPGSGFVLQRHGEVDSYLQPFDETGADASADRLDVDRLDVNTFCAWIDRRIERFSIHYCFDISMPTLEGPDADDRLVRERDYLQRRQRGPIPPALRMIRLLRHLTGSVEPLAIRYAFWPPGLSGVRVDAAARLRLAPNAPLRITWNQNLVPIFVAYTNNRSRGPWHISWTLPQSRVREAWGWPALGIPQDEEKWDGVVVTDLTDEAGWDALVRHLSEARIFGPSSTTSEISLVGNGLLLDDLEAQPVFVQVLPL